MRQEQVVSLGSVFQCFQVSQLLQVSLYDAGTFIAYLRIRAGRRSKCNEVFILRHALELCRLWIATGECSDGIQLVWLQCV